MRSFEALEERYSNRIDLSKPWDTKNIAGLITDTKDANHNRLHTNNSDDRRRYHEIEICYEENGHYRKDDAWLNQFTVSDRAVRTVKAREA